MKKELILSLLGKPHIDNGEHVLTAELVSAKGLALLVYLVVTGQSYSRSALAGLLWGDMPEENARANLRLVLTKLRKFIPDYLDVNRQEVGFRSDLPYQLDVARFEQLAQLPATNEDLKIAADLYRGDFLDDFILTNSPDFDHWAENQRERLRQVSIANLSKLLEALRHENDLEGSLTVARRLLAVEPWHEEAHCHVMRLLASMGQRSAALSQYETCRRVLLDELGVEPSPATIALYQQIKQGRLDTGIDGRERAVSFFTVEASENLSSTTRHNLPSHLTPFVGREFELERIFGLFSNADCRLVSLVGPGGIGKTRLALNAAQGQLERFRDGVRFVSFQGFASIETTNAMELLVSRIADVLDYTFSAPRPPRELILNHLRDKEILLLLDNFELLLSSHGEGRSKVTNFLFDVLKQAPGVKFLVTSRERLNMSSEWLVEVEGLPYPPTLARDAASDYPAVSLFLQHAQRIQPSFSIKNQEGAINRICQLVGGFPLAIELAANWVRLLPCAEIAARLEQTPDVLLDASFDQTGSPASIRVVLDSSWQMLSKQEQQVFRRLSVFRDGFSLDAAQKVASADLPLLNALMNKSLLRRREDGRYTLHELLSQYGALRLADVPDEAREVCLRHSFFYTSYLEIQLPALTDETDSSALAAVDIEIENMRAAWEWLVHEGKIDKIARYLKSMFLYYRRKGWFQEAVFVLEQACSREDASALNLGQWHRWLGESYFNLGDLTKSRHHLEQVLSLIDKPVPVNWFQNLWRCSGQVLLQAGIRLSFIRQPSHAQNFENRIEASRACRNLAVVYWFQNQFSSFVYIGMRGLNLAESDNKSIDLACALSNTAVGISHIPWPAWARFVPWRNLTQFYLSRAIEIARREGQPSERALVLEDIAVCRLRVCQWDKAQEALIEAAELARQVGEARRWEECLGLWAAMLSVQGSFADSLALQRKTLASAQRRGDKQFQFHELSGMAENALRLGNLAEAQDFLDEANGLLDGKHGTLEEIRFYGVLAQFRLRQGDQAGAQQAARMGMERILTTHPNAFYSLEGYAGPSEVYLTLLESAAGYMSTEEKMALANSTRRAGKVLMAFGNILPVGQPRAWLHKGLRAWLDGRPQKAYKAWLKSLDMARRLDMKYEEGRAHYEIGRHMQTGDVARLGHLSAAANLFSQTGATWEIEQVHALSKPDSVYHDKETQLTIA